jgi:hypothetical protein
MKPTNRISKSLEKIILKDIPAQDVIQIEQFLNRLEGVWLKWVKEHPNWKAQED